MKLNRLAAAIQRSTFLMDARAADRLFPMAERFLNGEKVAWFDDDEQDQFMELAGFNRENNKWVLQSDARPGVNQGIYADAPADSIAIITIDGTIMKDDFCGSVGTDTIGAMLMDALQSPSIIGVVLKMNSPGGTVEGTAELEEVVRLVGSLMPVEVFTDGMLCSAAYWIASPCRITASSGTVEIGSIGTAATYRDYSKGSTVVTHYVNADLSFDKNATSREALKGNYEPLKTKSLNPTNEIFHTGVKTNRGERLQLTDKVDEATGVAGQEPLTGEVYLAQKAMDLGLIDAIGNLQSVLDNVRERADSNEFAQSNNQYNMSLFGSKFKKLNATKTKKAEEITTEEIVAINEEFKAEGHENVVVISTAHFAEANANADALSTGLTAINAALGTGNEKKTLAEGIAALTAAYEKASKDAKEFGDQPGEKPTAPAVAAKEQSEGGEHQPAPKTRRKSSYDIELEERQAKLKPRSNS